MKISTRGRYGLRALVELASCKEGELMPLRTIAERHGMSEHYLEQLAAPLKKAGIIDSVRGAQGGYRLSKAPSDITAGDVIRVLEGTLSPVDCLDDDSYECSAASCKNCNTRPVWEKLYAGVSEALDNIRLSDLVETEIGTAVKDR